MMTSHSIDELSDGDHRLLAELAYRIEYLRGCIFAAQDSILEVLDERFGTVSREIEARVRGVAESDRLRPLLIRAVRISRPDDLFEQSA